MTDSDNWRWLAAAAIATATAALIGALIAQYSFGLAPCQLCLWQRWPYALAIPLGALAFAASPALGRILLAFAGVSLFVGASIALFHSGVEFKWWPGLSICAPPADLSESFSAFMDRMQQSPPPRCDERDAFFGELSMANWNVIISGAVATLFIVAAWRRNGLSAQE